MTFDEETEYIALISALKLLRDKDHYRFHMAVAYLLDQHGMGVYNNQSLIETVFQKLNEVHRVFGISQSYADPYRVVGRPPVLPDLT